MTFVGAHSIPFQVRLDHRRPRRAAGPEPRPQEGMRQGLIVMFGCRSRKYQAMVAAASRFATSTAGHANA